MSDQEMAAGDPISLPAKLDSTYAKVLHDTLLEAKGAPVSIDAGDVAQLGAQCLQVLLAAKRAWDVDNTAFEINDLSEKLLDALRHLGVTSADLGAREIQDAA